MNMQIGSFADNLEFDFGRVKNEQRRQLNLWLEQQVRELSLTHGCPLKEALPCADLFGRRNIIRARFKPNYPGIASEQDWEIALANHVR